MRGQQGAKRPWMKGKWDQDKEVQKTKRRCDSSKEIKDHLHFGFLSSFTVIIALWRQTPAPTQNDTNREWVILTNWAAGAKRILFRLKRGLQTVGSLRRDKDITVIGCCTLLSLISNHREQRVERGNNEPEQIATTAKFFATTNHELVTEMLCACVRTIWEIHP